MRWRFLFLICVFACGGGVDGGDASSDATLGGSDVATDASLSDVQGFDGYYKPLPGEFRPESGLPCDIGGCDGLPRASCNSGTGFCCSGKLRMDCNCCMCGSEPGCMPPAICCPIAGEQDLKCVPSVQDCPMYAKDQ